MKFANFLPALPGIQLLPPLSLCRLPETVFAVSWPLERGYHLNHSLRKGSQGKASQELANEILTFLGFSFVSVCMSISIPLHLLSNIWIPESAPLTSSYEQEFVLTSEFCFSLSFSVLSALRFLVSTTTNNKSGRNHLVGAWWLLLSCLANKKEAAPF